jgi:hypothetical protein
VGQGETRNGLCGRAAGRPTRPSRWQR